MKSLSMPQPLSITAIDDLRRRRGRPGPAPARPAGWRRSHSGGGCARRLLERRGIDLRPLAGIARQLDVALAAGGGDRFGQDRAQRLRLDLLDPRRARAARGGRAGRSSWSPTICRVATMSARNSGLSAWRSALRASSDNLADQILDVVEDEGEAAVEFLEPLRGGERFLAARVGELARRLPAGGLQKVEILPVERAAVIGRGEDDEADDPAFVDQRHAGPGMVVRRPAIRAAAPRGRRPGA